FFGEKGELASDPHHPLHDLNAREIAVMVPLILMVFWMGIFPNQFLDYSKSSVDHLVKNMNNYNLTVMKEAQSEELQASHEGDQE
ncbi:MAG: Fe-S-binding domain-containing protein, partial [Pseudobdellovibrionaceae bacterium]